MSELTPAAIFVGRDRQLTALRTALEQSTSGAGRVVMLVGEPGIGKTRTATEFARQATEAGALVLRGGCYEGEWAPPFGPFVEGLTTFVRQADPAELQQDMGFGGAPIARVIAAVRERLSDIPEPEPLQPDEERFRLFDAITQFLIALAARRSVVLWLDDLHWADKGTIALLRHVARYASRHRLLLLGAYRDVELDAAHPLTDLLGSLRRESTYEQLLLERLTHTETADLVAALAAQVVPQRVVDGINQQTEGNPFFIRELVQHLLTEDALVDEHRAALSMLQVPEGIRHVVRRRLGRVSPATDRLLTVAAAFNGPFHYDVAGVVADLDSGAALSAIDDALHAQLVVPAKNTDYYDFAHALIRHALYAELSPSRAARLHRRLAESMEQIYGADAQQHAAEVAYHYARSATLPGAERGVAYALAAADQAQSAYAYDEVAQSLRLALTVLPCNDPRRPRLLGRLGLALAWAFSFDDAFEICGEAAEKIAATEGDVAAARYLAEILAPMWEGGFFSGVFAFAQRGLGYAGPEHNLTWATLMAMEILRRETETPDPAGYWLETPERREVSRILHERTARTGLPVEDIVPDQSYAKALLMCSSREALRQQGWYLDMGEYRRGVSTLSEKALAAERRGRFAYAAYLWAFVFRSHTALGDFAAARSARDRSAALMERFPNSMAQTAVLMAGVDEWRMALDEDWSTPVEHLSPSLWAVVVELAVEQGMDLAGEHQHDVPAVVPIKAWIRVALNSILARTMARLGMTEMALGILTRVLPAIETAPAWAISYVRIACDAAETLWLARATDGIDVIARNLREKVIEPDFHLPMMDGRLALARLCALQHRFDEATAWFARARTVLDEQGARPLRAIVDYDEALMYARRSQEGDFERARPLLDVALARFRALGMPGWIRRGEHLQHEGTEWVPMAPSAMTEQPPPNASPLSPEMDDTDDANEKPRVETAVQKSALFRRSGDIWTIAFDGTTFQLRDSKGLRYLGRLLTAAGRELHVLDLIAELSVANDQRSILPERAAGVHWSGLPVLDAQAKTAYKRRLDDLREDLAEAEAIHDDGRIERARAEIEALSEQLAAAVGLGGRDRLAADATERARMAVTKRVKHAMKRIAARHPGLAHHLRVTIRTGTFCVYLSDRSVYWQL